MVVSAFALDVYAHLRMSNLDESASDREESRTGSNNDTPVQQSQHQRQAITSALKIAPRGGKKHYNKEAHSFLFRL